jgi:hypothetical protein
MKCYIVKKGDELKIIKVQPEDEAEFLQEHACCIMAEGSNVQEVIMQFAKLKQEKSEE